MQEKNRLPSHVEPLTSNKFNFEGFTAYLRSTAGGNRNKSTARSITSDVMMFFSNIAESSKDKNCCKIDMLFNIANLRSFLHFITHEKNYKPTTITEKIRRLKLAIQYIMSNSKDHCNRGNRLLKLLTMWCQSLSQDVTAQRKESTKYADTPYKHPSDVKVHKCFVTI